MLTGTMIITILVTILILTIILRICRHYYKYYGKFFLGILYHAVNDRGKSTKKKKINKRAKADGHYYNATMISSIRRWYNSSRLSILEKRQHMRRQLLLWKARGVISKLRRYSISRAELSSLLSLSSPLLLE